MGDPPISVEPDSVRTNTQGLTVYLPRSVAEDEEVLDLQLALHTVSARLRGEALNRADPQVRQIVEEGDAMDQLGSNQLQVLASGEILDRVAGDVEIRPRTITPNGDMRNDRARITYSLFGVLNTRVEIIFHTLAGEPVHRVVSTDQAAGVHTAEWEGLDAQGRPLDPGLYLCRVAVDADAEAASHTANYQVIAVAY